MRHRIVGRQLGRNWEHRRAMMRNMATSLIIHERIRTTVEKAKELRKVAERMITIGKTNTLHKQSQAKSYLKSPQAVSKLFHILGPRYRRRAGGYTRILKIGRKREGDKANMCFIEYVDNLLPKQLRDPNNIIKQRRWSKVEAVEALKNQVKETMEEKQGEARAEKASTQASKDSTPKSTKAEAKQRSKKEPKSAANKTKPQEEKKKSLEELD